jgi:DNA modification methylase
VDGGDPKQQRGCFKVTVTIRQGDCREVLRTLPDESVHCCVTSPPYFGLRDYGIASQIGLEPTPDEFVAQLVDVFREVRRVLRPDGTLWLNLGDSYARDPGKGQHKPGDAGKQNYIIERGGGRSASTTPLRKFRPGSGRADGVVDERGQRNRDGVGPVPGLKAKDLIGIPWRVAFALQADGWYLRQDIIWSKPNPMPESVQDRCTKAHEYIFMLSKSQRYHYDIEAIKEPAIYSGLTGQDESGFKNAANFSGKHAGGNAVRGERPDKQRGHGRRHAGFNDRWDAMEKAEQSSGMRNKRSVWEVATKPFAEAHFATFPPDLIEPCIKAGCPVGGTVLDPFGGAGTTGLVADRWQRDAILIELNPEYAGIAERRISGDAGMFAEVAS